MCGISGWFDIGGQRAPNRPLIQAMTDAIRHRGPDGEGFYFDDGIAFGHRRLAIIDLATGAQPMRNAAGTLVITFNGEIYNFRELRQELISRNHRFVTASDTEVILHAWAEWGEQCLEHLSGMFAFALWDDSKKTLFLARDRLGEKPLYYALLPNDTLIFASELKALLLHPELERAIDPCAVEEYFALGYVAEPRTIYKGASKLPAGSSLLLTRGRRPIIRRYWDAIPTATINGNVEEIADALIERLGAAVQSQLVSDVPIGAFLSGGVDSSGTTALMARATSEPINCFTIGFDNPSFDESKYAAAVAKRYSAHHVVERVVGNEIDLIDRLPRIFDEPFGDNSALPSYYLMQLARKHVTVALSGDAGDELFAGYRRYSFHANEERVRNFLPAALRGPLFGALARFYPQLDWAPRAFRARHTFQELALDPAMGYFWNLSVTDDQMRQRLYTPSFRNSLGGYHAFETIRPHWDNAPDHDPVARTQYVDLKTWLPGDILTKVDRTAMACSLETRVPMLDHRFVEWALGLPRAMKINGGESKFILKRAFERLVPRDVLYRPKQGFTGPLAAWFRGTLGENFARKMAARSSMVDAGYFEKKTISDLIEKHRRGESDYGRELWLLWMFELFLDTVHAPATAIKS